MLSHDELTFALGLLKKSQPSQVSDLVHYQLEQELQDHVRPEFYKLVLKCVSLDGVALIDSFAKAVNYLYCEIEKYFHECLRNSAFVCLKAVLFHTLPEDLLLVVGKVYQRSFVAFSQQKPTDLVNASPSDPRTECGGCIKSPAKCMCTSVSEKIKKITQQLYELDLVDRLAGSVVPNLVMRAVMERIEEAKTYPVDKFCLKLIMNWLDLTVFSWLAMIYGQDLAGPSNIEMEDSEDILHPSSDFAGNRIESSFESQKSRIKFTIYESYGRLLIDRLFEIIVDFPNSLPAMSDLKECLQHVNLRSHVMKTLVQTLERKLLRPAVNTEEILTAYTDAIKALRFLDPSGVILERVCEPFRQYLRQRTDTVRCIVSRLTDTDVENGGGGGQGILSEEVVDDENADDDRDWQKWEPEPIDSDPTKERRIRRSADIFTMLISIYGSKELFVKEYCSLLAERLLKNSNYDVDREHKHLEMLKLRFGESELHQCEVMLRDIDESKRIAQFVKSVEKEHQSSNDSKKDIDVEAFVLSAQFWPSLKEDKLVLPNKVKDALQEYCKNYEMLKGSRTLEWKPQFGTVDLELELNGDMVELRVSSVQACIISAFEERPSWTLEELSSKLCVSFGVLRRRIRFWQRCGVLHEESRDRWVLTNTLPPSRHNESQFHDADVDELESLVVESGDKEEELRTYWAYITGMLVNLESLTAERIHGLLRMFSDGDEGFSLEEVQRFLEKKVKEQQLVVVGGVYKLPKNK